MVGMTRFERATPSSQARCSTKLSHIPTDVIKFSLYVAQFGYLTPQAFRLLREPHPDEVFVSVSASLILYLTKFIVKKGDIIYFLKVIISPLKN